MMELWRLLIFSILMCAAAFTANAATDPSDAAALNVMYSSLNSPSQLTGWSSSGNDPCGQNWKGVTCSGSRVTQIKIPTFVLAMQSMCSMKFLIEKSSKTGIPGGWVVRNLRRLFCMMCRNNTLKSVLSSRRFLSSKVINRRSCRLAYPLLYTNQVNRRTICSVATETTKQADELKMEAPKEIFLRDYKMPDYYFETLRIWLLAYAIWFWIINKFRC